MRTMKQQLCNEIFYMMNFEITFDGVVSWFQSEGLAHDDNAVLRALLMPEALPEDVQEQFFHLLVDRHESVHFQRYVNMETGTEDPYGDVTKPLHQMTLRFLKDRELHGLDEAQLNLGLELAQDKQRTSPMFANIHAFFD